mmetsp:Transcript_27912/g.70568  ORF Transcript_27912/g.70568 Transcript_27912/m.70568 type:complete len:109 (-) Transcript_27912:250-576(-)
MLSMNPKPIIGTADEMNNVFKVSAEGGCTTPPPSAGVALAASSCISCCRGPGRGGGAGEEVLVARTNTLGPPGGGAERRWGCKDCWIREGGLVTGVLGFVIMFMCWTC